MLGKNQMIELEKEEFNKLKESCKKSIESIQEHLNSEELTLEEVDCTEEELRDILSIWSTKNGIYCKIIN